MKTYHTYFGRTVNKLRINVSTGVLTRHVRFFNSLAQFTCTHIGNLRNDKRNKQDCLGDTEHSVYIPLPL